MYIMPMREQKKHLSPSKLRLVSTEPWLAHMHDRSYRDGYQYDYIAGN